MKISKYCFLCLSDEGVFLNITPFNYKSLCGEVESYLPVKIEENTRGKQSKVCHKCAYELKQCSDFVKRYKESHAKLENKLARKQCCSLCLKPAKKGHIFKFDKHDNLLNSLWTTIEKLFDGDTPQANKPSSICLTCRYILDVLFDLTCLCQEMSKLKDKIDKNIDYSAIPKVDTTVIKRKTTNASFMRLKTYVINDSDSDSNTSKDQSTVEMNKYSQQTLRSCDQCKNSIEHGEDMYRFHRSGLTVCATCRGSIDLNRHNKKKSKQSTTNTKLCTVFLQDVLSDTALKQQKTYKIEKDSYGNQVYIIMESESEVEGDDKVQVSEESAEIQKTSIARSKSRMKSYSSDSESKRKKNIKDDEQNKSDLSKLRKLPSRSSARRNHYSDTDISTNQSQQSSEKRGVKRRNTSISSGSDADIEKKSNRKKLSTILEHFMPSKDKDINDDTLNIGENVKEKSPNENERKRKTRASSASSVNGSDHSSPISDTKRTKLSKTSKTKSKLSQKESLPTRVDADEKNTDANKEYICSICCAIHKSKLVAAMHELSHCKQLELKLHRLNISDKSEDEQQADGLREKQLNDELAEQQNEEITLSVNDDEDIEMTDVTDNTKKQPDKEIHLSSTEKQEEDSLQTYAINKDSIEETKVTDIITEYVREESAKTNEHEVRTSETTPQSPLIPTSMKKGSLCSDDIKNDQIQKDISNGDQSENEQKEINEEIDTHDKSKILENESTESEKNEFDLKVTDEDESKENDNEDNIENESIKKQQHNTEKIEDDKVDKVETDKIQECETDKIKDNLDKIEEIEKHKNEATEIIEEGQKEQNSDKHSSDELKDLDVGDAKLNDTLNVDEAQNNNLTQEKQKVMEDNDNDNDNQEAKISTVDNATVENSSENNVSTCNTKSTEDNCHSNEGENEQANQIKMDQTESSTSHSEKESKCIDDAQKLHSNLKNTNSSESTKNEEAAVKEKADQESTNTEVIEDIFDVATHEHDSSENVVVQTKRYSEMKAETLEDISREIQKSADMPSLEPISSMEVDNKELA